MSDRIVRVVLQAVVADYQRSMGKAAESTAALDKQVKTTAAQTHESMSTLGKGMLVGGAVVAAGFAIAVKSAMDFNAEMSLVKTLAHATPSEMNQLRDAALNMGQAWGFTAGQTAKAEEELVKAGISVKDIMGGALKGSLTLAAAGQIDVAKATEIATYAMTQFGLAGKDIPHVADLLSAGADKALGGVGDLGEALKSGGLVAHQFGVSIDQTVGTLAAFANAGLMGEAAGTDIRQMLLKLARPGKEAADTLDRLGIAVYGTDGKFVGFSRLAGELQDKLGKLSAQQRNQAMATIFGSRAIVGASILYAEGAKGIDDWTSKVNSAGFATGQALGKMDNLRGDLTKLNSAFQKDLIDTGNEANGTLRGMTQGLTDVVKAYGDLPGPVKGAGLAMLGLAGATALAGGAALVALPKYAALDAALLNLTDGAVGAKLAMSRLAYGAGAIGAVGLGLDALSHIVDSLSEKMLGAPPKVSAMTDSLIAMSTSGQQSGVFLKTFSGNLGDLMTQLKLANSGNWFTHLSDRFNPFASITDDSLQAAKNVKAFDTSLAQLVTSGHGDIAAKDLALMGLSASDAAKYLPKYAAALGDSKVAADAAAASAGGLNAQLNAQQVAAAAAAKSMQDDTNTIKAMFDPLFAAQDALSKQAAAQQAVNTARKKYGEQSSQYKQANDDALKAALDVEGAVSNLEAGLMTGTISLGKFNSSLDQMATAGLLTTAQVHQLKQEIAGNVTGVDSLAAKLGYLDTIHAHPTVTLATASAMAALDALIARLNHIGSLSGGVVKNIVGLPTPTAQAKPPTSLGGLLSPTSGSAPAPKPVPTHSAPRAVYSPMVSASSSSSGGVTYATTIINPVAEPASNLPRALREHAFLLSA